jgi:hypothetical protein
MLRNRGRHSSIVNTFADATRFASDPACRVEDEQPGHGPAHPGPAGRTLRRARSGRTSAHDPIDRGPPAQREVHVDQDAGAGTRRDRSDSRRSPSRRTSAARCGAETQQQRDRSSSQAGPCVGGAGSAVESVCLAQPIARRWPCADLFRRARGSSPRSDYHGGPPNGPPATKGDHERPVAMEDGRFRTRCLFWFVRRSCLSEPLPHGAWWLLLPVPQPQ